MAQVYQLSPAFSVLYHRLIVASKDADEARREKAVAENLMDELRKRCSSLEKEKCEALEKVKESIEAVNIAKMQKKQVIQFFCFSLQMRQQLFQLLIFFFSFQNLLCSLKWLQITVCSERCVTLASLLSSQMA